MADTSGFITGDDFIGFDLPSPGNSPAPSNSSQLSTTDNLLAGLNRRTSPYRREDGVHSDVPISPPSAKKNKKKRKSEGLVPEAKRRNNGKPEPGPRNLKEQRSAAERNAPWAGNVPWERCHDASEMLNDEIHAFYNYLSPTESERRVRANMIDFIANTIVKGLPGAEVMPFGSWQTGLYLPTGDIDLVVTHHDVREYTRVNILRRIATIIRSENITNDVAVIAKAKVPIIKFVTHIGSINIDISLNHPDNVSNGVQSAKIIRHYLDDLPGARELILVVKAFLSQRSMNEVFTGGLGSYSVICLVISFLQLHPKLRRCEMDARKNLGTLLCEFFELYGNNFNYEDVGISLRRGGHYFSKRRRNWVVNGQSFLLSIEDPQDVNNDIAKSSYGIPQVKMTFSGAYSLLTATLFERAELIDGRERRHEFDPLDPEETSILAAVMGITKSTEKFRAQLAQVDQGSGLSTKLTAIRKRLGANQVTVSKEGFTSGQRVVDRSTPVPPPRYSPADDPVGAIMVEDKDVEVDMTLDSDSESDTPARRPMARSAPVSRFASVSPDSLSEGEIPDKEDGEIDDSRYATHGERHRLQRARASREATLQRNGESKGTVSPVWYDSGSSDGGSGNANGQERSVNPNQENKRKPKRKRPKKAQRQEARVDGTATQTAAGTAAQPSTNAPRLTAEDRKAFWAAKGGENKVVTEVKTE